MAWGIFAVVFYLLGLPAVLRLVAFGQEKLIIARAQEKMARRKRLAGTVKIPDPWWPYWMNRLTFTFRDKRPLSLPSKKKDAPAKGLPRNIIFFILWGVGLLMSASLFIFQGWHNIALFSWGVFFIAAIFGIASPHALLKERQKIVDKMFQIAKSDMRLPEGATASSTVQVTEWEEYIKPKKAVINFDISYKEEMREGFMRQFNQVFGRETAWVPDDNGERPGWNFDEGIVYLTSVPPLPTMAKWDARYIDNPNIAWSFFPIALGTEHGVELENPETGEIEHVIGFDVSGAQRDLANEKGFAMSSKIATTPMCLVAGSTGGGKSLSVDTPIKVLRKS